MGKDGGYRVAMATQGTRGDFQPMLALACGMATANYEVLILGNEDHCKTAEEFGFAAVVVCAEVKDILNSEDGRKAMDSGDLVSAFKAFRDDTTTDWNSVFVKALKDFKPDLIIWTPLIQGAVDYYRVFEDPDLAGLPASYQPQAIPTEDFGPIPMHRLELEEGQPMLCKWLQSTQFSCRQCLDYIEDARKSGTAQDVLDRMTTPRRCSRQTLRLNRPLSQGSWPIVRPFGLRLPIGQSPGTTFAVAGP